MHGTLPCYPHAIQNNKKLAQSHGAIETTKPSYSNCNVPQWAQVELVHLPALSIQCKHCELHGWRASPRRWIHNDWRPSSSTNPSTLWICRGGAESLEASIPCHWCNIQSPPIIYTDKQGKYETTPSLATPHIQFPSPRFGVPKTKAKNNLETSRSYVAQIARSSSIANKVVEDITEFVRAICLAIHENQSSNQCPRART